MKPMAPEVGHKDETPVVFAKDQPQYDPLPAMMDPEGLVLTEWEPTAEELDRLLSGGRLRIWLYTFNRPLQPIAVEITEPPGGTLRA